MKMKCYLEEMWLQNFLATEKPLKSSSQMSPGIMLHASKSTHSARGSFLGPLPTPLIFSDLIHVVHNQRGMSSSWLPCLGDIIFLLPGKAPSDRSHSTQGSSACRPSRLMAVCETTIGNRPGYTREMFLHVSQRSLKGIYMHIDHAQ